MINPPPQKKGREGEKRFFSKRISGFSKCHHYLAHVVQFGITNRAFFIKGKMKTEQAQTVLKHLLCCIILGQGYLAKEMDLCSQVQKVSAALLSAGLGWAASLSASIFTQMTWKGTVALALLHWHPCQGFPGSGTSLGNAECQNNVLQVQWQNPSNSHPPVHIWALIYPARVLLVFAFVGVPYGQPTKDGFWGKCKPDP